MKRRFKGTRPVSFNAINAEFAQTGKTGNFILILYNFHDICFLFKGNL